MLRADIKFCSNCSLPSFVTLPSSQLTSNSFSFNSTVFGISLQNYTNSWFGYNAISFEMRVKLNRYFLCFIMLSLVHL